jgi:hypothetical protein
MLEAEFADDYYIFFSLAQWQMNPHISLASCDRLIWICYPLILAIHN